MTPSTLASALSLLFLASGWVAPLAASEIEPCALLTGAEAQSVASSPIGPGSESTLEGIGSRVCKWEWSAKGFSPSLEVSVSDADKMFPGMDAATLRQAILGGPRGLPPGTTKIDGVGEAATYDASKPTWGTATALLHGKVLLVVYRATDAPAKKEAVIALLKSAAKRL